MADSTVTQTILNNKLSGMLQNSSVARYFFLMFKTRFQSDMYAISENEQAQKRQWKSTHVGFYSAVTATMLQ